MPKNVVLAASLPAAADKLFDMYLDTEFHAAITGAPVIIEPRTGAPFRAFNGMLSGMILHVEPKRLIVQTWVIYLTDLSLIAIVQLWKTHQTL